MTHLSAQGSDTQRSAPRGRKSRLTRQAVKEPPHAEEFGKVRPRGRRLGAGDHERSDAPLAANTGTACASRTLATGGHRTVSKARLSVRPSAMRHAPSRQTLDRQAQYDQNQHQPDTNQAPPLGSVMVLVQIKTTALIKDSRAVCPSCEVEILDMRNAAVAKMAKDHGVRSVPAVVVDGRLADCCAGRGPNEASLRAAGIGTPR